MTKLIEDKLDKIPIINVLVTFLKKIKLPGMEGLSLYDLFEMYTIGIIKGTLTTRAGAIAFSFFTAIFPFLIFILILIPYIPIEDFQAEFLIFSGILSSPPLLQISLFTIFSGILKIQIGAGCYHLCFLLSIFLMANGVNAVFTGFENSYHARFNRNVFKQYLYALGIAIILALLLIVTVIVLGYFELYVIQKP